MNTLKDLPPKEVEELIDENVVMIDVRRPEEWEATGVIKNAYKMTFFDMFGNSDVQGWMNDFEKLVNSKDQQVILICAHANRTRTIGNYLIQNQEYTNIAHLEGGMSFWTDENRDVVFN